jgi:hypothetical protein
MMLCSLSDIKLLLGIADTSQDALLNVFASRISNRVVRAMGCPVQRATYTGEKYSVNNRQKLYLKAYPIQSVSLVTIAGVPVTGYQIDSDGSLYYGPGWSGNYWTRGMTYDPVAGVREIAVTYIAGWYLPGDIGYIAGQPESLPEAISEAVAEAVIIDYRKYSAEAEGLKSHSEGGISDSWEGRAENGFGLPTGVLDAIQPFVFKFAVA